MHVRERICPIFGPGLLSKRTAAKGPALAILSCPSKRCCARSFASSLPSFQFGDAEGVQVAVLPSGKQSSRLESGVRCPAPQIQRLNTSRSEFQQESSKQFLA